MRRGKIGDIKATAIVNCDGRFFFFFQAEDGIRDYKVTGVQTCALPIFQVSLRLPSTRRRPSNAGRDRLVGYSSGLAVGGPLVFRGAQTSSPSEPKPQIGRASCRGRV